MIRSFIDVMGEGDSFENCRDNTDRERFDELLKGKASFNFRVDSVDKKIKPAMRNAAIDLYEQFPFKGIVDVNKPELILAILEHQAKKQYYFGH